jgi:NAD(P)-dependent dehydrogenase (short-subunit alcohol dehydrogenase family)
LAEQQHSEETETEALTSGLINMTSAPEFGYGTKGAEVVRAFPERVQGKTCSYNQTPFAAPVDIVTVVITGPSEGTVGGTTAETLARAKPAHIILAGRTESKIDPVRTKIQSISTTTKVSFVRLDLSEPAAVSAAVDEIKSLTSHIDVLINVGGIMALRQFKQTSIGVEMQFATNFLGHFQLTNSLLPLIIAAGRGSRVVNVSSNGATVSHVRFDNIDFDAGKNYNAWLAYGQSKTANALFTTALSHSAKLRNAGITSFTGTPGLILDTHLQDQLTPEDFQEGVATQKRVYEERRKPLPEMEKPKPLDQGVGCVLVMALDPRIEAANGAFIEDCQVKTDLEEYACDPKLAKKLWALAEELLGAKYAYE